MSHAKVKCWYRRVAQHAVVRKQGQLKNSTPKSKHLYKIYERTYSTVAFDRAEVFEAFSGSVIMDCSKSVSFIFVCTVYEQVFELLTP